MQRASVWSRRSTAALAVGFLLTLPAVNTRIHASDEIQNFAYLRSLWFDRDFSFDNEYRYFVDAGYTRDVGFVTTFLEPVTETGLRPNYAPIGSAILWAPFYAIQDVGVRLTRGWATSAPADGFSPPYLRAITYASAVYGAIAIGLSIAIARQLTGQGVAAALAVLAGTPLIFYMYAMPGMSHATSAFAVAFFVWIWLRVRETWSLGGTAGLAAVGGLMATVREQDAILVLVPAADYVLSHLRRGHFPVTQALARVVVAGAAFVLAFLPQLLAYRALYDRLGPSKVISGKMHWTAPWAVSVVASPEHGWFVWTPLAALAIAGLVVLARHVRSTQAAARDPADISGIATLFLFAVLLEIYVLGSLASWHLAGAFGQRRFVSATVFLVVGLAALFAAVAYRRLLQSLVLTATALMIWWNIGLAIRFGENTMNRQRLELRSDLYGTFVDLPLRLPRVAYRYLFDRGSFYQSRGSVPPAK